MKIAIPVADGKLCLHFGHCDNFAFIEINEETQEIIKKDLVAPPPHQPGILPPWVAEQGAEVVIAGGMGSRAKALFEEQNVKVIVGAEPDAPENIAKAYIAGNLKTGVNACDH